MEINELSRLQNGAARIRSGERLHSAYRSAAQEFASAAIDTMAAGNVLKYLPALRSHGNKKAPEKTSPEPIKLAAGTN